MSKIIQGPCSSRGALPFRFVKRGITLLELMMVILLLAGVGSVVTLNYQTAISGARFESDLKSFKSLLRSVHGSMGAGFDPFLTITKGKNGIHLVYQEAMGAFGKKEFDYLSFNRLLLDGKEPPFTLFFGSKGAIYPKGRLIIEGEKVLEVVLKSPLTKIEDRKVVELSYPATIRELCPKKS